MSQLRLSELTAERIAQLTEVVEIIDDHGKVVGIFSATRKPIDMSGTKETYEELERRSKEPGGRTWAQIRERLLKL